MKKIISLILSVVMVFTTFAVVGSAVDAPFASGVITVEGSEAFNWEIAEEGGTLNVTGTGDMPAFADLPQWLSHSFTRLVIGEGITSVSADAFLCADKLEEVVLPEECTTISSYAFYGCSKLHSINFDNVTKIGEMAFYGCTSLKDIRLPASVAEIGAYALGYFNETDIQDNHTKLADVRIFSVSDTVAQKYATDNELTFIDVNNYTEFFEYEIADDSYVILKAYKECPYSDEIIIPAEIEGKKVLVLGEALFENANVKAVSIPDTVETIGDKAFANSKLEKIELPEGIKTIGASAFYGIEVKCVTIPAAVEAIGEYAFGYQGENAKIEGFEIIGQTGSVADSYAKENGFTFKDLAPAQPEITYAYADKLSVNIFWNKTEDAQSYEIYRKAADEEFAKIADVSVEADSVYCDLTVESGNAYTYCVVAVRDDVRSAMTNTVEIEFLKLATPELGVPEMAEDGILVKWNTVSDAEGYILYRRTADGEWEEIADLKGDVKSYKDTTCIVGEVYEYTVQAYNGSFESGCDYDGVTGVIMDVPELKKVQNVTDGIKITWEKVKGANRYIIGRKTAGTSWSQIAVVDDVDSFIDETAKSGTVYTYTIVPVHDKVTGFYNETGLTCMRLDKVIIKSASNASTGVKITWTPVAGCTGYRVYRKTSGGKYTKIATVKGAGKSSYVDKKAKNGKKYTYKVVAYNGSYVSYYNEVSRYYIEAPELLKVTSGKKGVTTKWERLDNATGYYVYRKADNGSFKKIATVNGKNTYLDKSAKKGITYTYKIKAYKSKTTSAYSNELSVKDKY